MLPERSMLTSTALVIFQNSMSVPMPALPSTTKLVLLSSRYRKIMAYIHSGKLSLLFLAIQLQAYRKPEGQSLSSFERKLRIGLGWPMSTVVAWFLSIVRFHDKQGM